MLENVPSHISWAVTKDVFNLAGLLTERCLLRSPQHEIHLVSGWQNLRGLECLCVKPDRGWQQGRPEYASWHTSQCVRVFVVELHCSSPVARNASLKESRPRHPPQLHESYMDGVTLPGWKCHRVAVTSSFTFPKEQKGAFDQNLQAESPFPPFPGNM